MMSCAVPPVGSPYDCEEDPLTTLANEMDAVFGVRLPSYAVPHRHHRDDDAHLGRVGTHRVSAPDEPAATRFG
jgi:hypothetical protein